MDETRPSWSHHGLITPQAYRVAECSLRALEDLGVPYVLVGGWAIAAYGSPVPSVDTDVYLHRRDGAAVESSVASRCGFEVGRSDTLELLDWDAATSVLSFDLDLGWPELAIATGRLFRERPPVPLRLAVGDLDVGRVFVPEPASLLLLKLCAWRARRFRWQAYRDPSVLARMEASDKAATWSKTELHWERKAGKDLYDAAWLVEAGADPAMTLALADEHGVKDALIEALTEVPEALIEYAIDLVRDVGLEDVTAKGLRSLQAAARGANSV